MPHLSRLALTASLLAALPIAAEAHAVLMQSQPASGGTAAAGSVAMEFRFNSRIDRGRSRLTLTAHDHGPSVLKIAPDGPPDVLKTSATLSPGEYVVRWQVLAIDGHITRGDVPFTVTGN